MNQRWSNLSLLASAFFLAAISVGCREYGSGLTATPAAFLPPDEQGYDLSVFESVSNISEQDFLGVIRAIEAKYQPVMAGYGATFSIAPNWGSDMIGAYAGKSGNVWRMFVYGGIARRPEMTLDAFTLILCHEIGHFLGGEPLGDQELAAEGQADWYATRECLPAFWAGADNSPREPSDIDPPLADSRISACEEAWNDPEAALICQRGHRAAWAVMHMSAARKELPPPQFDTPDASEVSQTNLRYPGHQCRLDTMGRGALRQERPRCWFQPVR